MLARVGRHPFNIDQILMDRGAFVGILRQTAPQVFPVFTVTKGTWPRFGVLTATDYLLAASAIIRVDN